MRTVERLKCRQIRWSVVVVAAALAALVPAPCGLAQLQFTEIMSRPGGDDALWEWVEIRNTSSSAIDLDGWVFDDDDDAPLRDDPSIANDGPNIRAANGNTLVPAGGAAVLYPADELNFDPARFTAAWGGGITLIPVDRFTSLTEADSIGLWPSLSAYQADAIADAATSPRRTFASAAAKLDYSTGFPAARNMRSIAWSGVGSAGDGAQWVESLAGAGGAAGPLHEVTSIETKIALAPINDPLDRGNPGRVPAGAAASGLVIAEIMYAPKSPLATAVWTSTDFEWVEIYNNTGAAIDFAATPHVFDDFIGTLAEPNLNAGVLPQGAVGILFNAARLTAAQMATMWGADNNYFAVSSWPALNNSGGDTIAIWDSLADYQSETIDGDDHRGTAHAVEAVVYNTTTASGWPALNAGNSIYRKSLAGSPLVGGNWVRAGTAGDTLGSAYAHQLSEEAIDHPGGDIGSPGWAPGGTVGSLAGDFNGNGRVDAADYTVWRNALGGANLLNDPTPGSVDSADYQYWRAHFGATLAGAGAVAVPEPAAVALLLIAASVLLTQRGRS